MKQTGVLLLPLVVVAACGLAGCGPSDGGDTMTTHVYFSPFVNKLEIAVEGLTGDQILQP